MAPADVFACGVCAFVLLVGKAGFAELSDADRALTSASLDGGSRQRPLLLLHPTSWCQCLGSATEPGHFFAFDRFDRFDPLRPASTRASRWPSCCSSGEERARRARRARRLGNLRVPSKLRSFEAGRSHFWHRCSESIQPAEAHLRRRVAVLRLALRTQFSSHVPHWPCAASACGAAGWPGIELRLPRHV